MRPLLCLLLVACTSVRPEFDAAKAAALADPGPAPKSWSPDLEVQLSSELVDDLLTSALDAAGPLSQQLDLGVGAITPKLHVEELEVQGAKGCADCLAVDTTLKGRVSWSVGPTSGKLPVTVNLVFDVAAEAVRRGEVWDANLQARRFRKIHVNVDGKALGLSGIDTAVGGWIDDALKAAIPDIPLQIADNGDLPLRAMRVEASGQTLKVQALSELPVTAPLPSGGGTTTEGFSLRMHPDVLVAFAAAESFRADPLEYGVVPVPTSLTLDGSRFALGLRLWRPQGRGWWRDYEIHGTSAVRKGKLKLTAKEVIEGEKSPGATLADPLAALAEGLILRIIEDAATTAVPAGRVDRSGGLRLRSELTSIHQRGGAVVIEGTTTLSAPSRR